MARLYPAAALPAPAGFKLGQSGEVASFRNRIGKQSVSSNTFRTPVMIPNEDSASVTKMSPGRTLSPLGYAWLAREFRLDPIPHFVESYAAEPGIRLTEREGHRTREVYPHTARHLTTVFEHLDFALKREGLHLELLRAL